VTSVIAQALLFTAIAD